MKNENKCDRHAECRPPYMHHVRCSAHPQRIIDNRLASHKVYSYDVTGASIRCDCGWEHADTSLNKAIDAFVEHHYQW